MILHTPKLLNRVNIDNINIHAAFTVINQIIFMVMKQDKSGTYRSDGAPAVFFQWKC